MLTHYKHGSLKHEETMANSERRKLWFQVVEERIKRLWEVGMLERASCVYGQRPA